MKFSAGFIEFQLASLTLQATQTVLQNQRKQQVPGRVISTTVAHCNIAKQRRDHKLKQLQGVK